MFLPYAIKLDGFTTLKHPPYKYYLATDRLTEAKKRSQWRNSLFRFIYRM